MTVKTFDLRKAAKEKIILAAHRGTAGGNIPCNTLTAYEIALKQGADMIEIDISKSADGKLFIFHPGMEHAHLNKNIDLSKMTWDEISRLRYVNLDNDETQFSINTLDEVLEQFKDRCYINCDKFWDHPREITDCIRAHGMTDQVLVKSPLDRGIYDFLESYAPELPYMVVVIEDATEVHRELLSRNINYMGQELIFATEDNPICSPEYLDMLRKDNILSWANAIVCNYRGVFAAGHSDDTAVGGDMDNSWGWLVRRGFDCIQTDWMLMLKMYLEKENLMYRK